ncbi:MAG: DUF4923 family protein [Bacteroides sp.]|nr:DUF4923 family protein [Bacteroides sp.]
MNKRIVLYTLTWAIFLFSGISPVHSQTIKKVISSAIGHFTSLDLEGTWKYEGVAVEFQTDNLLKKAGGKVATGNIEKKIDQQLSHLGFQSGITEFIFHEDGTFRNVTNGRAVSGTYTYDSSDKEITLKYANHIPVNAKVTGTDTKISLLFEANSFLSVATFLGSNSGVSAIQGISSILKSYDSMMIGMELKKE